jgi:hypothetical protein
MVLTAIHGATGRLHSGCLRLAHGFSDAPPTAGWDCWAGWAGWVALAGWVAAVSLSLWLAGSTGSWPAWPEFSHTGYWLA